MKGKRRSLAAIALGTLCFGAVAPLWAQSTPPLPQYGTPANLDQARRAMAGAVAEARRLGLPVAVAVVDTAGQLVAFERMDNTQTGSIAAAQDNVTGTMQYRDLTVGGGVDPERFRLTIPQGASVERVNGHIVLGTRDLGHLNALVDAVRARGALLTELSPLRSTLEDVFVDLVRTGEGEEKVQ